MTLFDRIALALAAFAGLAGVGLSATAAHLARGPNFDTAARFLLIHAAVLVGLAALTRTGAAHPTAGRLAAGALLLGLALFAGDLVSRTFRNAGLFPMAAPSGGVLLMLGWGLIAAAALIPRP